MKKKFAGAAMFCLAFLLPSLCFAGDMNANEQSVYNAASGTFSYNGEEYRADGQYLAQLQAYLCQDDIDLAADQAAAAIARMRESVEQGVAQGYLVPVGNSAGQGTDAGTQTDTETEGGTPSRESQSSEQQKKEETGQESQALAGAKTQDADPKQKGQTGQAQSNKGTQEETSQREEDGREETTAYEGMTKEEQKAAKTLLKARPKKKEASNELSYDKNQGKLLLSSEKGESIELGEDELRKIIRGKAGILKATSAVMLLILLILSILLWKFQCFTMQRPGRSVARIRHKQRQRLRSFSKPVMVFIFGWNVALLMAGLSILAGVLQRDQVMDHLTQSGYYQETYEDMRKDLHNLMQLSGCGEDTCDTVLSWENFRFDARKQMQALLAGKEAEISFEERNTKLEEEVEENTALTQENKKMLTSAAAAVYMSYLEDGLGRAFWQIRIAVCSALWSLLILAGVNIILSGLIFKTMYVCRYQGLYGIGSSLLAGALIMAAAAGLLVYARPLGRLYAKQDFLYVFLSLLQKNLLLALAAFAAAAAVLGLLVLLMGKSRRKLEL